MTIPSGLAILLIATAVLVAVVAAVVGWLVGKSASATLTAQLAERTAALGDARSQLESSRLRGAELDRRLVQEQATREMSDSANADKIRLLQESQEKWITEFDALSRKALDQNSKSFIDLARTQFDQLVTKADERGEQRRLKIEQIVQPLGKSLADVQTHIKEVEKQRTEAYSSLTEQVKGLAESQKDLQKEAGNLVNALRKPAVRGRWGEVQLRRVVELAGMAAHCDFDEQHTVQTDDGRLRPDLVVRLPGDRIIVVDAKAPLEAYLRAIEADDESDRESALKQHAAQIRSHIKKLGAKAYFDQFDRTPDLVVLFLPGESFFYSAVQSDPSLYEFGIDYNVVVATPMTLIALLRAVAYGWRQEQVADNARQISALGQELYDRICGLADHFIRVGSGLTTAVASYNKAVGSLESRVLVSARRFKELGSGSSKEVAAAPPVDATPRRIELAELRAAPMLSLSGDGGEHTKPPAPED